MQEANRTTRAIITLSMIAFILAGSAPLIDAQASGVDPSIDLSDHLAIRINGDADLAAVASSGHGTIDDPFVIAELRIDASGRSAGIFIGNTTEHLIIRDCRISGAAVAGYPFGPGAGIALYNVRNCIVTENTCIGCTYGIYLQASDGNTISKNECTDGTVHGMFVHTSDWNTISGNTFEANDNHGIYLFSSSHNQIIKNAFVDNGQYGLYLFSSSDYNQIYGNAVMGNNGASGTYSSSHVQAFDSCTNHWNSTEYGNYWSDWASPDHDNDGIIDLSYAINGGHSYDRYPVNIAVSISSPSASTFTRESTIVVSGTATDGSGQSAITWRNTATGASGTCTGTAAWTAIVILADGANEIVVTISGEGGMSISDEVTVICDSGEPTAEVSPTGEGVGIDAAVVVEFSERMDQGTVNITVAGVNGTVSWDGNVATFTPDPLDYNTDYAVRVVGQDLAGNELEISWTFKTMEVGSVNGMLVDKNGNLLYNATVHLGSSMMTTTDAFGRFYFKNVSAGTYILSAVKEGYDVLTMDVTVTEATATNLGDMEMVVASPSVDTAGGSDNTMLFIIIGIAAAAAVGVFFFIKKRKR